MLSVLVATYTPFPSTLSFSLPESTTISSLQTLLTAYCPLSQQSLSSHSVRVLKPDTSLSSLASATTSTSSIGSTTSNDAPLSLRLSATNNDSCRDLNGRRLSTIKEATKLAEYIKAAPDRLAQQKKEAQAKLDALNAEIARLDKGIHSKPTASGSGSTSSSRSNSNGGGVSAGQKRRLEESKFLNESKQLNEGVRDAVKSALMKKRKKNKTTETTEAASATTSGSSDEDKDAGKGKKKNEGAAVEAK
ncbi:BQ2448_7635 [Microbotryum intermedium]|uniref:BQ2448_7635 protein n=1 Tax=Microbotryum intermedium TaxID=269621 RepID=A0A238FU58_9BASI|nr:BQ2448_7635 [Microbotryum intermedium]